MDNTDSKNLERLANAAERHADALQVNNFLMLLGMGAINAQAIPIQAALARTSQGVLMRLGQQHEREAPELEAEQAKAKAAGIKLS